LLETCGSATIDNFALEFIQFFARLVKLSVQLKQKCKVVWKFDLQYPIRRSIACCSRSKALWPIPVNQLEV
jgi:hypothetical protein